jgi:hypothetical protein
VDIEQNEEDKLNQMLQLDQMAQVVTQSSVASMAYGTVPTQSQPTTLPTIPIPTETLP